jgi:glucose-6-phosphate 1-dehydrogenase
MDLTYKRRFVDNKIPEAYEALILDALKGDHSNFVRHDELDHAWKVRVYPLPEEERWSLHDAKLNSRGVIRSSRPSCTG